MSQRNRIFGVLVALLAVMGSVYSMAIRAQTPKINSEKAKSGEYVPPPKKPTPNPVAGPRPVAESKRADAPTRKKRPRTTRNKMDGAKMVWIPAGEFLMGSKNDGTPGTDKEAYDNEKPQRTVYLSGYWMYKYPVTVGQYKKFCLAINRKMPNAPDFNRHWAQDNHPMVNVSWEDAKAYCDWAKVILPTEAQWEKASRGTQGWKYPWSRGMGKEEYDDTKLWCSVKTRRTSTASVYRTENVCESPFGCVDMAGNVWQWCNDWFQGDYYASAPRENPEGPGSSPRGWRVLRGGAWDGKQRSRNIRSASRNWGNPTDGSDFHGFRASSGQP